MSQVSNESQEEIKQESLEIVEEAELEEVAELSLEDQARQKGWRPADEAVKNGLDPKDVVDAKTFLERGPLFDEIKRLKRQQNRVVEFNQTLMKKFHESEMQGYQRAISELRQQKEEAEANLDPTAVRKIDEQINDYNRAINTKDQEYKQTAYPPEALDFIRRNGDWFGKDQKLTQYAVSVDNMVRLKHPGWDDEQIYAEVESQVNEFRGVEPKVKPVKQEEHKKQSYVAAPSRGTSSTKSSYSFHDLNDAGKDVFTSIAQFKKDHGKKFTVDDFLKEAKATGTFEDMLR